MTHAMNDNKPQIGPSNGVVSGDLLGRVDWGSIYANLPPEQIREMERQFGLVDEKCDNYLPHEFT